MRFFFCSPLAICLFCTLSAGAQNLQNSVFDREVFLQEGLKTVQQSLEERVRPSLSSDPACPAGGTEVLAHLSAAQGKIFSALNTVHDLMHSIEATVDSRRVEQVRCGSCQQINAVSYLASIAPEKNVTIPECENKTGETFVMDLERRDDVQSITEQILSGKNNEGRRLQAACPDPCSYYVTTAETTLANGQTHLTLNVQCGQPRGDSVFSAVYGFKAGLIHQWSCTR